MGGGDVSKPEDVPQDVWDAVSAINDILLPSGVAKIARLVMAERERCAKVCENQAQQFLSPQYSFNQPLGSFLERFACGECADAIRKGTP